MFGLTQYFSLYDLWSPLLLLSAVLVIILYLGLTGIYRNQFIGSAPVPLKRKIMFIIGILLLYLAQGGPIYMMSHMMFTFHMILMSITYIIVPPLLLLGIPGWLWRFLLERAWLKKLLPLTHPILCAVMFNAFFSIYHVPDVHDFLMTNYAAHISYYVLLFVTALLMWWPVVNPVQAWTQIADVKKMGYIFLNGVLITPACALIIFASDPLYATYSDKDAWIEAMGYCITGDPAVVLASFDGPQFFNWFNVVEDQQLGGIIMKLVQEIVYGLILAYVFKQWFTREGKDDDDFVASTPKERLNEV
ncbi:cytochrome c oxidase assembly factor CtaG [Paenibacillus sp. 481]|uniref:cytochrome c oxidase assembly factor CtaG n=1 Tax=Paenibacillus sp. 481 TaxID=2835869 RepID=UPI001E36C204|nr:cytochrome c oxidase assembly factor CtaG [Paenibacillus sp. 481]UHA75005.1 cytochrome c oxidase assembly factor CtaG [Paenibacillus sp. 481]